MGENSYYNDVPVENHFDGRPAQSGNSHDQMRDEATTLLQGKTSFRETVNTADLESFGQFELVESERGSTSDQSSRERSGAATTLDRFYNEWLSLDMTVWAGFCSNSRALNIDEDKNRQVSKSELRKFADQQLGNPTEIQRVAWVIEKFSEIANTRQDNGDGGITIADVISAKRSKAIEVVVEAVRDGSLSESERRILSTVLRADNIDFPLTDDVFAAKFFGDVNELLANHGLLAQFDPHSNLSPDYTPGFRNLLAKLDVLENGRSSSNDGLSKKPTDSFEYRIWGHNQEMTEGASDPPDTAEVSESASVEGEIAEGLEDRTEPDRVPLMPRPVASERLTDYASSEELDRLWLLPADQFTEELKVMRDALSPEIPEQIDLLVDLRDLERDRMFFSRSTSAREYVSTRDYEVLADFLGGYDEVEQLWRLPSREHRQALNMIYGHLSIGSPHSTYEALMAFSASHDKLGITF